MKKKKQQAAATAVAAVTSAGVVVGGLFPTPQELLQSDGGEAPTPVTEILHPAPVPMDGADDTDDDTEDEDEEKRRSTPGSRVREWLLGLPLGVRAGVGVPLWCVGWLALTALSALWGGLLSPAMGTVAGWAATSLALLGAFALTAKAMFPDLPLKKIVNRRNFFALLLGAAGIGLADAIFPLFFDEYSRAAALFRAVCSAGLLGIITALFARREQKRRRKAAEAAGDAPPEGEEESRESAQERALRLVRELVDEVSPRKRI